MLSIAFGEYIYGLHWGSDIWTEMWIKSGSLTGKKKAKKILGVYHCMSQGTEVCESVFYL